MRWSASAIRPLFGEQVSWAHSNSIAHFSNPSLDFINIRSDMPMITDRLLVNIFVLHKRDEMWIGLVDNATYHEAHDLESSSNGLFYYGARESKIGRHISSNKRRSMRRGKWCLFVHVKQLLEEKKKNNNSQTISDSILARSNSGFHHEDVSSGVLSSPTEFNTRNSRSGRLGRFSATKERSEDGDEDDDENGDEEQRNDDDNEEQTNRDEGDGIDDNDDDDDDDDDESDEENEDDEDDDDEEEEEEDDDNENNKEGFEDDKNHYSTRSGSNDESGSIQRKGSTVCKDIPYYGGGDWISIWIDRSKRPAIRWYKNGVLVAKRNEIPKTKSRSTTQEWDGIFNVCGVLDLDDDALFIEEVLIQDTNRFRMPLLCSNKHGLIHTNAAHFKKRNFAHKQVQLLLQGTNKTPPKTSSTSSSSSSFRKPFNRSFLF
ncbi:hypothetical protein RFI_17573 [Reticulomyxa filosa]|uniref:Uncharacterized protein n=1 Tax=Reticulomyxa filosa TaxID=46433 RepID=X6N045_RETFI|nr:hypothetical protein RFI_17573 [Reticulomyxa filosa]|eukprot:ETO19655.1 hypothetical protein RFI_17573 [Reticulomyxa filosa]